MISKFTCASFVLISTLSCTPSPETVADMFAPIAFGLANSAINNSKPNGDMTFTSQWENMHSGDNGLPIGTIMFVISFKQYPGKSIKLKYDFDGTENAKSEVNIFNDNNEKVNLNLYNTLYPLLSNIAQRLNNAHETEM